MAADLIVGSQGPLMTARIARPPDNLFTLQMCRDLTNLLLSPPATARALVLTAAGPNFCLGRERTAMSPEDVCAITRALADLNTALSTSRLAVIAQVSGDAAGFGVGLAGLADVAIADSSARFWFPEAAAGLAPALVLTWLSGVLGRRLAFWLTATGQPLDADSAQRAGLINQAVPPDQLAGAVRDAVAMLLKQPPEVCAEIKRDLTTYSAPLGEASHRAVERLALRSLILNGQLQQ